MTIKRFNLDEGHIWEAIEGLSPYKTTMTLEEVVEKLNSLCEENEQLKAKVKRLQDIATRTESEKEEYADLYCKCENELIKNRRRCDGV